MRVRGLELCRVEILASCWEADDSPTAGEFYGHRR